MRLKVVGARKNGARERHAWENRGSVKRLLTYCTLQSAITLYVVGKRSVARNSPRSIYQNSNMTPRLSDHFSTFGLFFFVLKSLLGIAKQWSRERFAILSLKPRSHVGILINRTWAIRLNKQNNNFHLHVHHIFSRFFVVIARLRRETKYSTLRFMEDVNKRRRFLPFFFGYGSWELKEGESEKTEMWKNGNLLFVKEWNFHRCSNPGLCHRPFLHLLFPFSFFFHNASYEPLRNMELSWC